MNNVKQIPEKLINPLFWSESFKIEKEDIGIYTIKENHFQAIECNLVFIFLYFYEKENIILSYSILEHILKTLKNIASFDDVSFYQSEFSSKKMSVNPLSFSLLMKDSQVFDILIKLGAKLNNYYEDGFHNDEKMMIYQQLLNYKRVNNNKDIVEFIEKINLIQKYSNLNFTIKNEFTHEAYFFQIINNLYIKLKQLKDKKKKLDKTTENKLIEFTKNIMKSYPLQESDLYQLEKNHPLFKKGIHSLKQYLK
jgi:hypothetical protein